MALWGIRTFFNGKRLGLFTFALLGSLNIALSKEIMTYGVSSVQFEDMSDRSAHPFQTMISFENQQYRVSLPEQPDLDYSNAISVRLSGAKDVSSSGWTRFGTNMVFSTQMSKSTTVFGLNEFYLQFPLKAFNLEDDVSIGRRLQSWSDLDRRWNLGVFESRLYLDSLRTESQGLTGLFYKSEGNKGSFLVFATPVTIPSQGPEISEEAGVIKVDSRWYQAPTKEFQFQNSKRKIDYRIDIRDRLALAQNGGAGVKVGLGDEASGAWVSGSYAYKAMNDLVLLRENYLSTQDNGEVKVTVRPSVGYHSVYATNLGWTSEAWNASVAYLSDIPEAKQPEPGWISQNFQKFSAYSAHLGIDLSFALRDSKLSLDYMKIHGGRVEDINSQGEKDDLTFMDRRFNFYEPFRVQLESRIFSWGRQVLSGATSYLFDSEQKGSLVKAQLSLQQRDSLLWFAGVDILGVEESTAENSSTGFLNRYRSNDRTYAGMSYAF